MKISVINENEYIVYLNKYYYKYDKEKISNLMKNILAKLKKHYGIEVYSLFNVDCYINEYYGIILKIKREYDPFSLYTKKTDVDIVFYDNSRFLYKIKDYFLKDKLSKSEIYIFNNNYYLELLCDEYYKIEEFYDDIIYKNIKNIVKNSD